MSEMPGQHLYLAAGWTLWCVLHSALISRSFMRWMTCWPARAASWHRLMYVLFSVLSLAPLLWYQRGIETVPLWQWAWPWEALRWTGVVVALGMMLAAARVYDNAVFFGLRQIRERRLEPALGVGDFRATGILGRVRHPYYSAGVLFLLCWGSGDSATAVMQGCGILYLLIGAVLEERKLLAAFGDRYRAYQQRVPMFIPRLRRSRDVGE